MDTSNSTQKHNLLRQERIKRNWRQRDLAEQLGTTVLTVKRWERGYQQPSTYFQVKLSALFGKSPEQLGLIPESQATTPSQVQESVLWSVPFLRNPFFTGRDLILHQLHTLLTNAVPPRSYALQGLGGIGKTQLAIEYAYRHRGEYQAIFWIEAETQTSLTSSFVRLATMLAQPEQTEEDQRKIVAAVLRWFNGHEGWLLIFDNVEDPSLIKPFLPASDQGALLFTTRLQTLGTLAQRIDIAPMTMQEGTDFLLARTNHPEGQSAIRDQQEYIVAQEIVREMGNLPLALEQAGAYIEATQCSLRDYLHLFQQMQQRLLDKHEATSDHPLSVSQTFTLAFERVVRRNLLASDLLKVCAFLAAEEIPEWFFLEEAPSLSPAFRVIATDPLAFSEALKVALSYSLLQRHPQTRMLSMHRLVQAVLRDAMTDDERDQWRERTIRALNAVFPEVRLHQVWARWEQCFLLLPHVFASTTGIPEQKHSLELASLLTKTADYLLQRAQYKQAESLFQKALYIRERMQGHEHPDVALPLNGLADLYREQGQYEQAEPLYQQALNLWEQASTPRYPEIALLLNNLAILYSERGQYKQAEPLFQKVLRIREQALGPQHPEVALLLNNLAILYCEQGQFEQAEPLLWRALHINEQTLGPQHPQVAYPLTNLADLYQDQGQYEQARPLYQRALSIREQTLGPQHPQVAYPLNGLANLARELGQYEYARSLYQRTLMIRQQHLSPQHPDIAETLHDLARFHHLQQQYQEALSFYQQALAIREQVYGSHHPKAEETQRAITLLLQQQEEAQATIPTE